MLLFVALSRLEKSGARLRLRLHRLSESRKFALELRIQLAILFAMAALADGFLGPLFFVWLGASLTLLDVLTRPQMILLGVAPGVGAVLAHAATRLLGLPLPLGLLSSAQLGVPVAAVTIGTQSNLLLPGEAAALIIGALITIGVSAIPGGRAVAPPQAEPASSPAPPQITTP